MPQYVCISPLNNSNGFERKLQKASFESKKKAIDQGLTDKLCKK